MAITYPLIHYGGSVYATENNLIGGTRYISVIEGLEHFAVSDAVGGKSALDFTRYSQYQAVKDGLVVVRFPLIDVTKGDAIRDVVQAAITGLTTYTLDITCDLGTFTFTAKPAENPVSFTMTELPSKWANLEIRQYCTD